MEAGFFFGENCPFNRANLETNAAINTGGKVDPEPIGPLRVFSRSLVNTTNRAGIDAISYPFTHISHNRMRHRTSQITGIILTEERIIRRRWLLTIPLLMGPAQAQPRDNTWDQIKKRGILRVGADPTLGLPYFGVDGATRQYQGFEWEFLQALEQILKIRIRVTEVLWPQQRRVLIQKGVDAIFNAQEAADLEKGLLATRSYYVTSQAILTRDGVVLQKLIDLVGLRVGVLSNSGGAALVNAFNLYKTRSIRVSTAPTAPELLEKLARSQLDAVILDTPLATWLTRSTQLKIQTTDLLPVPIVGVVRGGEVSVKNALDQGIQQLIKAGTLEVMLRKWQLWNALQTPASIRSSPRG